ncbi:MAG: TerB family tellurite resistance protein [Burkholderiales bacterium]|nr:TerB family tellurite resistance protein [Burkholderiales bacterium]
MNAPQTTLDEVEQDDPIELTPFLSLAAALLYMLMADGEIDDHESSQLQAVIGGNQDVLELAYEYVETVSLDQFLNDALPVLSNEDKLCILCNLCDCLLADGVCQAVEEELFQKICHSFGYSKKSFSTYYSAIALKNEKSLLGPYEPTQIDENLITPHLAMAASLIYMMSADGDIAEEEIGQLQVVIGEFENLQAVAMNYVRSVKMNQFCIDANKSISADQKLLILANVCDSMMSDGVVADIEKRLFENMLKAFDVTEKQFSSYYAPLEIKNFKPFGSDEEVKSLHTRKRTRKKAKDDSFGMNLTQKHSNAAHGKREANDAANQGDWQSQETHGGLSDIVSRTMQENIQQVNATFEDPKDVAQVSRNATEKIRQDVMEETGIDANLQKVQDAAGLSNVQKIGANGFQINRQGIDFSGFVSEAPILVSDIRVDDLQKNIEQVHDKLDRFKPKGGVKFVLAPLFTPSHIDSVVTPVEVEVEFQVQAPPHLPNSWPELNFQPVAVPKFTRPPRKRMAAPTDVNTSSQALAEPSVELFVPAATTATTIVSGAAEGVSTRASAAARPRNKKWLKLLGGSTVALVLPLGVYAYGALYPMLSCQGQEQQTRLWSTQGDASSTSATQENRVAQTHRIEIRRGEIYLDNHRFPLYKELNRENHFAAKTPAGFQGSYTSQAVENMSYAFDFNTATKALKIYTHSSGLRFIDGEMGQMKLSAVFSGQCEKPWF